MNKQEKREQLISEYIALINLKVSVTERVHNTAAERYGFTYDECAECLQEAIIIHRQQSINEKKAKLTEDFKTMVKYGIRPTAGVEMAKAQEIWGLSYDDVQECWRNAIA